ELLNPINSINMVCHLLEMEPAQSADRMTMLIEKVMRSTGMMQRFISDLLDLATIQSGTLKIKRASVPVAIIVAAVLDAMGEKAREKSQHLSVEISDDVSCCHCDQGRIVQILWNLIGNAIKFTPAGGTITVNAFADAGTVHFVVADTGPGLEKHELPKVFDRFWQSGESSKSSAGLGLAIAKGIVEAHEGKIWVESEKGEGCFFHFVIPVAAPK
ncbi:MAG TPA: HAMP domain-containing sensor histidine kinase, partial [Pseudomonadales bacterium]